MLIYFPSSHNTLLAFYRTDGYTLHTVSLEKRIYYKHGNRAQNRYRHLNSDSRQFYAHGQRRRRRGPQEIGFHQHLIQEHLNTVQTVFVYII